MKAAKEGDKEEHHVGHPCIAEQSLPESTTFIWCKVKEEQGRPQQRHNRVV